MLSETWGDQYRRLRRSYERLKRAVDEYIDRDPELHDEANSRDIFYHFCADAYHLKDYIKNSTNQSQGHQERCRATIRRAKEPERVDSSRDLR